MRCYAYVDESGNTGLKLFDPQSDTFWTGTLISFSDLDIKYAAVHKELLAAVGATELHGNELGLGRIDKISRRIACFIREKKIQFSFVRVFKPWLAATKLFDLAFDSGNNPAVPPQVYGVNLLRRITVMHFVQLLNEKDLVEFWGLFQSQDPSRFGRLLAELSARAPVAPYDRRTIQILTESLNWASRNPEKVLDPFGAGDSPNFVAFTSLFQHLHEFHHRTGHTIGRFVHDETRPIRALIHEGLRFPDKVRGKYQPNRNVVGLLPFRGVLVPNGGPRFSVKFRPANCRYLYVGR
ncbi:MAG: hypothetical protein EPN33_01275 [Acidobacteria bacterium]|nr:MAG: hypothetical protein EPN33_01275 [Acidobacteriota bacterium]